MALTRNIVDSQVSAQVPSGVTVTERTLSGVGITSRIPEQVYTIATSTGRNAVAATGYAAFRTALDGLVNTYLETFYDPLENVTFDIVITSIEVTHTAATIFNTGTENYTVRVLIYEQHD